MNFDSVVTTQFCFCTVSVVGFQELVERMEQSLEGVSPVPQQPKRTYSARNRLRREMVGDHPVYSLFVSGSSTGSSEKFFCRIRHRDVSMRTRGAGEFSRHLFGPRHWYADVTYRVREGLPVINRLKDLMELSAEQISDFRSRPCKGLSEGFSFPEDLLPACTRVHSTIPLLTMVICLLELLRCGGSYLLLCKLWGCFRVTLGPEYPLFSLNWSRAES